MTFDPGPPPIGARESEPPPPPPPPPFAVSEPPVAGGPPIGAEDATPSAGPPRRARSATMKAVREWTLVIAGALAIALIVRAFLIAAFYIPSESMVPTLEKGDRVLVNKLSYKLHDIGRGDVVVFERPDSGPNPCKPDYVWSKNSDIKDLIKRVIGLPGDKVEARDGKMFVNDQQLVEPYLKVTTASFGPVTVPAGCVFVMGDNRPFSQDSRFFGAIPEKVIVGRAFVRVWPVSHLGWL
jgi:signal peptidase I